MHTEDPSETAGMLLDDEESQGTSHEKHTDIKQWRRTTHDRKWIALHCFSAVLAVFIFVQVAILLNGHSRPQDPEERLRALEDPNSRITTTSWQAVKGMDCGSSNAEAQAKGCIFDVMRFAWTPAACYDEEAGKQALRDNPWGWYKDENGTVALDEVDLMQHRIAYTHWGYHIRHCQYIFTLARRAATNGGLVPFEAGSFYHVLHCGTVLAENSYPVEMKGTAAHLGFTECGKLLTPELDPH